MAEVGVVLKVPQATHARFKEACAKHDRSMQKVLLSLIEGWVANDAPAPSSYGRKLDGSQQQSTEDLKARQAIVDLASTLQKLQVRLRRWKTPPNLPLMSDLISNRFTTPSGMPLPTMLPSPWGGDGAIEI